MGGIKAQLFCIVFLLWLFASSTASAEDRFFECGGTWTNKPCNKDARPAYRDPIRNAANLLEYERDRIIAEVSAEELLLKPFRISMKLEIDDITDFCKSPKTPLADCRKKAQKTVKEIQEARYKAAKAVRDEERLKLQKIKSAKTAQLAVRRQRH
jgi:hypothetical protein